MRCRTGWKEQIVALAAAGTLAFSGCGPSTPVAEQQPSDVELAVNVPAGGEDPGTLPDDSTMNPPDILLDADEELRMTIGAREATDDSGEAAGSPPVPVPDGISDQPELVDGPVTLDQPELVDSGNSDILVPPTATGPEDWRQWPQPDVVLVVSGQQHGYIEPCGCTGLANQKGGLMRRYTLFDEIRGKGWELVPLDAGNQIRRSGKQAAIKFATSIKGLEEMGYGTVGIGADDLKLGASELLSIAADDGSGENPFATANVEIIAPDLVSTYKKIEFGGHIIGVTTVLDPESIGSTPVDDAIQIQDMNDRAAAVLKEMQEADCEFKVLMLFGSFDAARKMAKDVPGYDLIVAGDTVGEPKYKPDTIEGTNTKVVMTGDKGMFVGLVGLYKDQPLKYAKVPLDDQYEDARPMLDLMAGYQNQLKQLGLEGLGIKPADHISGTTFVGTKKCGECHTTALAIWENTPHAEATEDIVNPGERSEIPRHHDPECLSCHVTGWNPQEYYPYTSGYLSLDKTPLMVGNGCENCHGPGKAHVDAEEGTSGLSDQEVAAIRETVRLTLDKARDKCLECHDLDNSPDFHKDGAFEDYWAEVEHYGVD